MDNSSTWTSYNWAQESATGRKEDRGPTHKQQLRNVFLWLWIPFFDRFLSGLLAISTLNLFYTPLPELWSYKMRRGCQLRIVSGIPCDQPKNQNKWDLLNRSVLFTSPELYLKNRVHSFPTFQIQWFIAGAWEAAWGFHFFVNKQSFLTVKVTIEGQCEARPCQIPFQCTCQ